MRIIDQKKFNAIVAYARKNNPFYAQWIPQSGAVPVLTRQILQQNNDLILNGAPVLGKTSGSTGVPVRVSSGPARLRIEAQGYRRMIQWLGPPQPRIEIILPLPGRPTQNLIPIDTPLTGQILALAQLTARHDAMTLVTYPTNAVLLAQAILDQRIRFPSITRVVLMSEPLDPGQRALIKRAFPRARIWTTYSCVELGAISGECPHNPRFHHFLSDKLGVEILDDKYQPVPFGHVGQIVITDYYNRRMPFIRYALGDLAAFGKCPCGKIPMPAFSKILGKVRGALLHADGRRVPFVEFAIVFRDIPGLQQFQVIQEELRRFTVKIVASRNIDAEINAAFLKEFGYPNQVNVLYVKDIPRDKSGKFFISICKV